MLIWPVHARCLLVTSLRGAYLYMKHSFLHVFPFKTAPSMLAKLYLSDSWATHDCHFMQAATALVKTLRLL